MFYGRHICYFIFMKDSSRMEFNKAVILPQNNLCFLKRLQCHLIPKPVSKGLLTALSGNELSSSIFCSLFRQPLLKNSLHFSSGARTAIVDCWNNLLRLKELYKSLHL